MTSLNRFVFLVRLVTEREEKREEEEEANMMNFLL
jgi:hypothetical protein